MTTDLDTEAGQADRALLETAAALVTRVPEGFVDLPSLAARLSVRPERLKQLLSTPAATSRLGLRGGLVFDPARTSANQMQARPVELQPALPPDEALALPPITLQRAQRQLALAEEPGLRTFMTRLAPTGYLTERQVDGADEPAVQALVARGYLARQPGLIYDPLQFGPQSAAALGDRARLARVREQLAAWLAEQPGQTARRETFIEQAGDAQAAQALLARRDDFVPFNITVLQHTSAWVRLAGAPAAQAEAVAREQAAEAENKLWEASLPEAGDRLRPGARDGQTAHQRVVARTYTLHAAAQRLDLAAGTVLAATREGVLPSFTDPAGQLRLTAAGVEAAAENDTAWDKVSAYESLSAQDIALASGMAYRVVREHLEAAGLSRAKPVWGQIRGQWGLPASLREFWRDAEARRLARAAAAEAERRDQRERARAQAQAEFEAAEREQAELRRRLLTVFPAWDATARTGQLLTVHLGPTNSGKTYAALQHLVAAGRGWYLAPLRLLAHEVYEQLNRSGTLCHLLTGEESIRVPGAQITASTIEMFSPTPDEACTIIDEAHMLADEQRGWAWTRALMEAKAPDLHVIGAPVAGPLVERLAEAAGIAQRTVRHERLTPLAVSPRPWSLDKLPPQTILVAFSRAMALGLKSELERQHRRRVSIIYGDLPPEVRRRQAARFAEGETEICVATDAVGMGLNLPADNVCFFEVEKFDGRQRRTLTPTEVRQIGGRAGRFGLSQAGLVGALNPVDLSVVRRSLDGPETVLPHARVAPVPEALGMLSGTLAERLRQWMELRSIPENWRQLLRPMDLSDAIELAELLSPREVQTLGDADALLLVRAPTSDDTRDYWRVCAQAIVRRRDMPVPPEAPAPIHSAAQLTEAELSIRCADIYLWLSQRRPFAASAPEAAEVRAARAEATREVDAALQRRIDTARRCRNCGRPLATKHRFNLCTACYRDPWRAS
jgi:hypothetical protein